jgi:hypothetical protein
VEGRLEVGWVGCGGGEDAVSWELDILLSWFRNPFFHIFLHPDLGVWI